MSIESEQAYAEHDSFMINLFSMGFQTEDIQQFLQRCRESNVQPTVSDAIDFIVAHDGAEVPSIDTSLPMDTSSNDYSVIEAGIPTVIGFNKSVNYKPLSPLTPDSPIKSLPQQSTVDRESFYKIQKQNRENQTKQKQTIKEMIQNDRKELRPYYPPADCIQQQMDTPVDQTEVETNKQIKMSRLSIRLLTGNTITRLFTPMDTLGIVLSCLQEEYSLQDVTLSQSFPRIDYTSEDMLKSLLELGFTQGGCLVVKKREQNSDLFGQPTANTNSEATQAVPPVQQPALQVMAALQNNHDWVDQGKVLGGEYINKSVFLSSVETRKSPRKRFIVSMEITSLKELAFRIIIRRAKVNDLPRFNNLSPGEGQMVLARLIREDILSPKLVEMFIGCRMHTIDLTSCKLITNELLHRFTRIKSISKFVIKGSPYLTDKAVSFIGDMPHLTVLVLEDCSNLTNISCQSLSKLKNLKSLNLRATKVTDKGILHMVNNSGLVYIDELNLSSTCVTQAILLPIAAHCSLLRVLNLESTKVNSLPSLDEEIIKINLENLRMLDFSNCVFKEDTNFSGFFQFLNLKILKVYGSSISDFTFLKYLKLESIYFPRVIENTDGSSPFKFLMYQSLKQLNLTNCLSIDRKDMACIGNMHSLTELILKNCRCLDSKALNAIVSLSQLTYLDLEHTMLTDDTAIYIFPHVTHLVYLNLSGTQVSNLLLKSQMLNKCLSLTTLNLNYTRVSNSGLSCLSIPYLSSLFLNGTFANEHTEAIVMGNCINLKNLTLNNLHADNTIDSDREDD